MFLEINANILALVHKMHLPIPDQIISSLSNEIHLYLKYEII